jgi:hypothetical protein
MDSGELQMTDLPKDHGSTSHVAASDYRQAWRDKTTTAFADALADDVVLEASLLNLPLKGRDSVSRGLAAASRLYEKVIFTDQATAGSRQYLEWKVKTFSGDELLGVTILTRNNVGIIQHIAIHHRPLEALMRLSAKIGENLRGEIDPAHFLRL